jgi:hypothetical protein
MKDRSKYKDGAMRGFAGRILVALLAVTLVLSVAYVPSSAVYARDGSSVTSIRWSKSKFDATIAPAWGKNETWQHYAKKYPQLRMHIKDNQTVGTVTVYLERGTAGKSSYAWKSVNLSLEKGDNTNGTWMATLYFGASDKGTWRITDITTTAQNRVLYHKKNDKGIGPKVRVTAGPTTKLKLKVAKKAVAGSKITLKATLTKKGKAFKKQKVYIYVSYTNSNGVYKSKTYKVKTNKKGVAAKKIKMPAASGSVYVGASYSGKRKVAQPSSATSKYVARKYKAPALAFATSWNGTAGSAVTATATVKYGKTPLKGIAVDFYFQGMATGSSYTKTAYTNAKGVATASGAAYSENMRVEANTRSTAVYSSKYASKSMGLAAPAQKTAITLSSVTSSRVRLDISEGTDPSDARSYLGSSYVRRIIYYNDRNGNQLSYIDNNPYSSDSASLSISGSGAFTTQITSYLQVDYSGNGTWSTISKSNTLSVNVPA